MSSVLPWLSFVISVFAVVISAFTAWKTVFSKFSCDLFLKPRIVLGRFDDSPLPLMIVATEVINHGSESGAVDDIVLVLNYVQNTTGKKNKYAFYPKLLKDKYNIFKNYEQTDFEPFQMIACDSRERFKRHVVFAPEEDENFVPMVGNIELKLYFRTAGSSSWKESMNSVNVEIDQQTQSVWSGLTSAEKRSVMLDSDENSEYRKALMDIAFN